MWIYENSPIITLIIVSIQSNHSVINPVNLLPPTKVYEFPINISMHCSLILDEHTNLKLLFRTKRFAEILIDRVNYYK